MPYKGNEKEIMECLRRAFELIVKMDSTHPNHLEEFVQGIHKCQSVIIHRIIQRKYPEEFPTIEEDTRDEDEYIHI